MYTWIEALLAAFLLTSLMLAASSRLLHCIRIIAFQGLMLGILPVLLEAGKWDFQILSVSAVNIGLKGLILPGLIYYAMKKAEVRRELEPFVGYGASIFLVLLFFALSFWLGQKLPLPGEGLRLAVPVAFSTMFTGLFLVMARRKAITQAIGFLVFENGVSLFGTGLMLECGLVVELGILLDVFALVFIMGIALFRIRCEFAHVDADRLNHLGDNNTDEEVHHA